jgi:hypothetical protein
VNDSAYRVQRERYLVRWRRKLKGKCAQKKN